MKFKDEGDFAGGEYLAPYGYKESSVLGPIVVSHDEPTLSY